MNCNSCKNNNSQAIIPSPPRQGYCPFLEEIFEQDDLLQNLLINNEMKELFDGFPLGLIKFDCKNKLSFLSKQAQGILGYNFAELKDLNINEFIAKFFLHGHATESFLNTNNQQFNDYNIIVNKLGQKINICLNYYKLSSGQSLITFLEIKKIQVLENLQVQTQTILDSVSKIIVLFNKNNEVIRCNHAFAKSLKINAAEIIGINELELYKRIGLDHSELLNNSAEEHFQVRISIDEGFAEEKTLLVELKPIHNVDEEYLGKILIASDISSFIIKQEGSQQQEKLAVLGQMAAGIVHEVRNPLTAILGYAKLIEKKTEDNDLRKYAEAIQIEGTYLNKIVSDFLAFAKPQSPQLKKVCLNDIVRSLALILESNSFLKEIELIYNLSSNAKEVLIDENQIKQVILNIVKNALEAMKDIDKGLLRISTGYREDTQESYIIIANNGKGIPQEEIKLLGTPFFTTKDKGTGLGLSICYQIIKEHNARIDVKSGHKMGTLFKISFNSL